MLERFRKRELLCHLGTEQLNFNPCILELHSLDSAETDQVVTLLLKPLKYPRYLNRNGSVLGYDSARLCENVKRLDKGKAQKDKCLLK